MITLFSMPRAFTGRFKLIQENAIRSWREELPNAEILLLGADEGVREACDAIGARHLPNVARNEQGAFLVNGLFELAEREASHPHLCFINSDIILLSGFGAAFAQLKRWNRKFLMTGERCDLDVANAIDYADPKWQTLLRKRVAQRGIPHGFGGVDYFCFPKNLLTPLPPFVLGRQCYDNWFFWQAQAAGAAIVDISPSVTCIHQDHPRSFRATQNDFERTQRTNEELKANAALLGSRRHKAYTILNATHVLRDGKIHRALAPRYLLGKLRTLLRHPALPHQRLPSRVRWGMWRLSTEIPGKPLLAPAPIPEATMQERCAHYGLSLARLREVGAIASSSVGNQRFYSFKKATYHNLLNELPHTQRRAMLIYREALDLRKQVAWRIAKWRRATPTADALRISELQKVIAAKLAECPNGEIAPDDLLANFWRYRTFVALVQIIDQKVSTHLVPQITHGTARRERLAGLTAQLNRIAARRPLPDCEFLVCIADSLKAPFSIFGTISFADQPIVPIPLGCAHGVGGGTNIVGWDERMQTVYQSVAERYPWHLKEEKCVFRGTLRLPKGVSDWRNTDRGRLYVEAQKSPELFDIGFNGIHDSTDVLTAEELARIPRAAFVPLAEQQRFKYIISVGAWSGWADRIRMMPFLNSVWFLHESESHEFFGPLLRPYVHYVPIKRDFSDLVAQVRWAKEHDEEVRDIVANANQFAADYLSEAAMDDYLTSAVDQYAARARYRPTPFTLSQLPTEELPSSPVREVFAQTIDYVANEPNASLEVVMPAHTVNRRPPRCAFPGDLASFPSRTVSHQFKDAFVAKIPDGRVWDYYGSVVTRSNKLLADLSGNFGLRGKNDPILKRASMPSARYLRGTAVTLAAAGGTSYFHWMSHVLPRAHLFQMSASNLAEIDYCLVNKLQNDFQWQTLHTIGFPREKIVQLSAGDYFQADWLIVPSLPGVDINVPPWVHAFHRKYFLTTPPKVVGRRIYISRRAAGGRRVLNEEMLSPLLDKYQLESIVLENLSVAEQAVLFASADFIVGAHGAGFTNLSFCRPKTKVLEFFSPHYMNALYWTTSSQLELDYSFFVADESPDRRLPKTSEDMFVSIEKFERALSHALESHNEPSR